MSELLRIINDGKRQRIERAAVRINGKDYPLIRENVYFSDWREVEDTPASNITKRDADMSNLNGLIIKGYEMKFSKGKNENYEVYSPTAFDDFLQDYFVANNLNMVVDINHQGTFDWHAIAGRVIYAEVNTVGLYIVAYVPRTFPEYDRLLFMLQEGLLQGFSKEGYASDWDYKFKDDGTFDYELINKIKLLSISLVSNPANGIAFEREQETKNTLVFMNKTITKKTANSELEAMFNK